MFNKFILFLFLRDKNILEYYLANKNIKNKFIFSHNYMKFDSNL